MVLKSMGLVLGLYMALKRGPRSDCTLILNGAEPEDDSALCLCARVASATNLLIATGSITIVVPPGSFLGSLWLRSPLS